jgi:hypothetical protein
MTTGVSVTINGVPVASSWTGTDLIAVDGLAIRWGREDPYEQPEPSILTLTLIDRRGNFVTDESRVGQEVIVRMSDPARVMFRGALSKPKAVRRRVHNPLNNLDETVWVVTFTASDSMAALAMAVFLGDGQDGWIEGAGGWGEAQPNLRIDRLWSAGVNGLVSSIRYVPDIVASPTISRSMHGQAAADGRTALELLQQAFQGVPLGVVNYDPELDWVTIGQLATASPVALVLASGKIALSMSAGVVVPASKVGVDNYQLESTVAEAIDAVQVGYWWYGKDPSMTAGSQKRTVYTQGFIEARTTRYNAKTRRVLKVDTEFITFDPTEYTDPAVVAPFNRFPAWLLAEVLSIVNGLNGQLRLPTLKFDAKRLPLPAAVEDVVYRPTMQTVPLYFAGSVFNGMTNVGPQFQIIGGTLRYDDGWSHEVTVCAARPNSGAQLTVAQLVTNSTPTLADFDPDISLADFGLVTTGLT